MSKSGTVVVPRRTTTLRVNQIPLTATADELFSFFRSKVGSVYACKISTFHYNWKSKGFGLVQFDDLAAVDKALSLKNHLPIFQGGRITLSPSSKEIVVRPVDRWNRVTGAVLHVGWLVEERWLEVLQSWDGVRVDFMPERKRLDVYVDANSGKCYKMEIMYRDVAASFGCSVLGVEDNAVLLKLKYAPKIYHRLARDLDKNLEVDRYYVCNEDVQFTWVRSTDFSCSYSIGHSSHICLEFSEGIYAPNVTARLPFYEELGDLNITEREVCPSSRLVPLVNCSVTCALSYEIIFQLNSLVHAQKISCGQINDELFSVLSVLPVETAKRILLKFQKLKSTCYEPLKFINDFVGSMRENSKIHLSSNTTLQSENLMSCHRVLITPSRVYLLGPEIETSNYVVKHHAAYASDFLRVSFVDEDWSKLPPEAISTRTEHGIFSQPCKTDIHDRILYILGNGISIGAKKFEFLAFSASQLRSNSVWMFASSENMSAARIREWMGNFKKIRSVSKCAARMGQLFSSSWQTSEVSLQDVHIIPDIEVTNDGINYCFSDGIGKISESFAMELSAYCKLSKMASSFQIRYGGYKGVVAVDRSSSHKLSLRASMLKFDSDNIMLNITKWSESMPCYLNREIICLLSTLGIDDKAFEDLLQEQLQLMEEICTEKLSAIKFLESMAGGDTKTALKMLFHGYVPPAEPYLLMVLKAYCEYHLSDIRSRCRIFVPKGRILIGCLDETGSLNYGQVYVRVSLTKDELQQDQDSLVRIDDTTGTVIGKVVVTKNPCLHPGDIQVLQAVRNGALEERGLVDCILFPQKGERPHPNECSGGDLDGDQYFVCWDRSLVPIESETPMDYIGRRPRIMDHEVNLQEIHNFFVSYMINDTLGAISTAHLVLADREPAKARSSKCLQLAKLHSMAVDFAKTGAPAEMPKVLRPKEYPDFMERHDKPMYVSNGILGKLYRMTIDRFEGSRFLLGNPQHLGDCYDHDLEVKGFESFIDVALECKSWYSEKFSALMNYYGAESEEEILTGNLRNRMMYLKKDRNQYGEVKDRILVSIKALQKEVRAWVTDYCDKKSYQQMTSACYHVSYHPSYCSTTDFISFPWIFCDELLIIKSAKDLITNQGKKSN